MADPSMILDTLRSQAKSQQIRVTQHAQEEMTQESILLDQVIQAINTAQILENYPNHRRGACCLLHGVDATGRDIHIVCTTSRNLLIIITVYLPTLPKWVSPTQRSKTS